MIDGQVMTPMQKIVGDSLRPEGRADPRASPRRARTLDRVYRCSTRAWPAAAGPAPAFTLADCAAAPALYYACVVHRWDEDGLADLTRYFAALTARPSVARVIDEAREYRNVFPLPWPDYAD